MLRWPRHDTAGPNGSRLHFRRGPSATQTSIHTEVRMRISVFPKGELDDILLGTLSVFDWIHLAQPLPIEGLELYSAMFVDTTTSFTDRVSDALDEAGKEMPMLCVSPDFTNPDPRVRSAEVEREALLIA